MGLNLMIGMGGQKPIGHQMLEGLLIAGIIQTLNHLGTNFLQKMN